MTLLRTIAAALSLVATGIGLAQPTPPAEPAAEVALLADDTRPPTLAVRWPTRDGSTTSISGVRDYLSPGEKTPLGANIHAYVAIGGSRYEKGQGHERGQLVRIGLYKRDATKPFFEGIAEGARFQMVLSGVRLNQPAVELPDTALMHLRYMLSDLTSCGLDANARNLYITADADDPIRIVVAADSGRWGALDGSTPESGKVTVEHEPGGSMTITWDVPYALLRHLRDPYQRTTPGGFFEPPHFHAELEFIPRSVAEREAGDQSRSPAIRDPKVTPDVAPAIPR